MSVECLICRLFLRPGPLLLRNTLLVHKIKVILDGGNQSEPCALRSLVEHP